MPSFLAPIQMMLPELSSPHGALSQPKAEGFIVPWASHKAITSNACRDRKLPTTRQADSRISNKIGDFQVAPRAVTG
jgi:hypothetical protein